MLRIQFHKHTDDRQRTQIVKSSNSDKISYNLQAYNKSDPQNDINSDLGSITITTTSIKSMRQIINYQFNYSGIQTQTTKLANLK